MYMYMICLKRRQGENGTEAIFEANMAKNFPLMYERYPPTDSRCENTMNKHRVLNGLGCHGKTNDSLTFSITITSG